MENELPKEIIAYHDPESISAEAIRCLRTNVLFINTGKATSVIGLTSSLPNEGKSFLTSNLAVTTANSRKKTVVVDCDLRRGGLSRLFNITNSVGLSDVLQSSEAEKESLPLCDVGIENLSILPAGKPPANPAELLGLNGMDRVLDLLREKFDIVYVDVPPVLAVTDPVIVAKKVDAIIFVVKANCTAKKAIQRAYGSLKSAGINVIGTVLNNLDTGIGYYHKYKYKYGKYGS